jgi:hypothetical protein
MIEYHVAQNDSILTFDSNVQFGNDAIYRDQKLTLTLLVRHYLKFKMNEEFSRLFRYGHSYDRFLRSDVKQNVFYFNESGLDCSTCLTSERNSDNRRNNYENVFRESSSTYGNAQTYEYNNFDAVDIVGPFSVSIAQGDEYRVVLSGNQSRIDEIEVLEEDGVLTVGYIDKDIDIFKSYRRLNLRIIMPSLTKVEVKGATVGDIAGFEEDKMSIKLSAASELTVDADIDDLVLKLSSASTINLIGAGDVLDAKLSSASELDAYKFSAQNATIKVTSGAKAKVYATETLSIRASTFGEVVYRGGATVTRQSKSTLGNIIIEE